MPTPPPGFAPDTSDQQQQQQRVTRKQSPEPAATPPPGFTHDGAPPGFKIDMSHLPTDANVGQSFAGTALTSISAHQDLPFILGDAAMIDRLGGYGDHRTVKQAFELYKKNPVAAYDQWGDNAPTFLRLLASKYPKTFEGKEAQLFLKHPTLAGVDTFAEELFNPMSVAEGGGAGKIFGWLRDALGGAKGLQGLAQPIAHNLGFGSPLATIFQRAGTHGVSWLNSLLHEVVAPEKFLKVEKTSDKYQRIFNGLTPEEQEEVFNLAAGEKLHPKFAARSDDLQQRADELKQDIQHITALKQQHGLIKNEQIRKNYVPMGNAYEFEPRATIESELNRRGGPGMGRTENKEKTYQSPRAARQGGLTPFPSHVPATQYGNWRRVQLQRIGFEDALGRAPKELKLPANKGLRKALVKNHGSLTIKDSNGEYRNLPFDFAQNPRKFSSPQMRRGAIAPELLDFMFKNDRLRKYLDVRNPIVPGEHSNFMQRLIALSRNMIVTLPFYHPIRNVAVNDAAARGLAGLPGRPELGGFITQTAKATAQQFGVPATVFAHGARQYANWLDRALKAGAVGEFGEPSRSALGGERARVLTEPNQPGLKGWVQRADRAFTKYGEWNRGRVFGTPGEESFAVSLFKDAVTKGHMSEADASQLVRNAYHDYFNLDPNSPWSYVDLFMPWRKTNTKFWLTVLGRKPQYLTSVTHAVRNYNEQTAPDEMSGPYARNPFQVLKGPGGVPMTLSLPGRDVVNLANAAGSAAQGHLGDTLGDVTNAATATLNPPAQLAKRGFETGMARFSPDVEGPETSPDLLLNTKAPGNVQTMQLIRNVAGTLVPVPVIGFVARDIARRGLTNQDAIRALMLLSTAGYGGTAPMSQQQRYLVSAAKRNYKKAYDTYKYHTHDEASLQQAWQTYMDSLQGAGIVGQ